MLKYFPSIRFALLRFISHILGLMENSHGDDDDGSLDLKMRGS